ncbi:hypothetical protein KY289_036589 [Solanum tuberosum]|nr:hypothetical protein KY289_036589 [Solanum tuberosum]
MTSKKEEKVQNSPQVQASKQNFNKRRRTLQTNMEKLQKMMRREKAQTSKSSKEVKKYEGNGQQRGSNAKSVTNIESINLVQCSKRE